MKLVQDTTIKDENSNTFIMRFFMEEKCDMPNEKKIKEVLKKYFGEEQFFSIKNSGIVYAPKMFEFELNDKKTPSLLNITSCVKSDFRENLDDITKSQMWDCEDAEKLTEKCKFEISAFDILGSAIDYRKRAIMLMKLMKAIIEIFPSCIAIQFLPSKKIISRNKITNQVPLEEEFVRYTVNIRRFSIKNSNDKLIDTVGMGILGLPDIQYHFHGIEVGSVVNHAYSILVYLFSEGNVIKNGDTVDGIYNGKISQDIQWKCRFEKSLIQPVRDIIDIYTNEYAAGNRNL